MEPERFYVGPLEEQYLARDTGGEQIGGAALHSYVVEAQLADRDGQALEDRLDALERSGRGVNRSAGQLALKQYGEPRGLEVVPGKERRLFPELPAVAGGMTHLDLELAGFAAQLQADVRPAGNHEVRVGPLFGLPLAALEHGLRGAPGGVPPGRWS